MKVLIADDEHLARASLKSMLEELRLPLKFVGEAANGAEMVELVSRHQPDVAFVDIRMPSLNGLEAIRQGRIASPQTRWFILTGFAEFDYAQEAVRLGVSDYLLKPVDPSELKRVLNHFTADHLKTLALQNERFERDMMALCHGQRLPARAGNNGMLSQARLVGAVFCVDSHLARGAREERQLGFYRAVRAVIGQIPASDARIALFALAGGDLATAVAWEVAQDTAHAAAQEQSLQAYLRAVGQAAHRASDRDLAITVLLTEECSTCQALKEQFDQLRGLAPLRAVCGVDRVWEMAALRRFAALPHRLRLSRLIIEVCECYRERAFLNYMKALQNCSRVIPVVAPGADDDLKKALADFVYRSTRCAVQPNQSLREWIQSLEEHGEQMLGEKAKDASQKQGVIGQVIALIDQNYMSDIGVGQIARQLHIAPNYLSALFRKETGVTFMEYLTQTRMWRAKELLTDPDVQVQEVAQQVGYSSPRYFSRRFFKHFGCYPSECRDQLKEGRPVRE